ncbi:hypothetical protein K525DRAFT_183636 [Schizophyllum commune Loenen D]|nr:hypothetical protein K525DRAFT_183636 [Schizophyllum commune Loenen D]
MSNSLYPWIADYLVRIAEQHGVKIWDAPTDKKKAQIIEFKRKGRAHDDDDSFVWAEVSDKDYRMPIRFNKESVAAYRQRTRAHMEDKKSAIATVTVKPMHTHVPLGDGKGVSHDLRLALDCTEFHLIGSFGEEVFGKPKPLRLHPEISAWEKALRKDGGEGNFLKERKEAEQKVVADTADTTLPPAPTTPIRTANIAGPSRQTPRQHRKPETSIEDAYMLTETDLDLVQQYFASVVGPKTPNEADNKVNPEEPPLKKRKINDPLQISSAPASPASSDRPISNWEPTPEPEERGDMDVDELDAELGELGDEVGEEERPSQTVENSQPATLESSQPADIGNTQQAAAESSQIAVLDSSRLANDGSQTSAGDISLTKVFPLNQLARQRPSETSQVTGGRPPTQDPDDESSMADFLFGTPAGTQGSKHSQTPNLLVEGSPWLSGRDSWDTTQSPDGQRCTPVVAARGTPSGVGPSPLEEGSLQREPSLRPQDPASLSREPSPIGTKGSSDEQAAPATQELPAAAEEPLPGGARPSPASPRSPPGGLQPSPDGSQPSPGGSQPPPGDPEPSPRKPLRSRAKAMSAQLLRRVPPPGQPPVVRADEGSTPRVLVPDSDVSYSNSQPSQEQRASQRQGSSQGDEASQQAKALRGKRVPQEQQASQSQKELPPSSQPPQGSQSNSQTSQSNSQPSLPRSQLAHPRSQVSQVPQSRPEEGSPLPADASQQPQSHSSASDPRSQGAGQRSQASAQPSQPALRRPSKQPSGPPTELSRPPAQSLSRPVNQSSQPGPSISRRPLARPSPAPPSGGGRGAGHEVIEISDGSEDEDDDVVEVKVVGGLAAGKARLAKRRSGAGKEGGEQNGDKGVDEVVDLVSEHDDEGAEAREDLAVGKTLEVDHGSNADEDLDIDEKPEELEADPNEDLEAVEDDEEYEGDEESDDSYDWAAIFSDGELEINLQRCKTPGPSQEGVEGSQRKPSLRRSAKLSSQRAEAGSQRTKPSSKGIKSNSERDGQSSQRPKPNSQRAATVKQRSKPTLRPSNGGPKHARSNSQNVHFDDEQPSEVSEQAPATNRQTAGRHSLASRSTTTEEKTTAGRSSRAQIAIKGPLRTTLAHNDEGSDMDEDDKQIDGKLFGNPSGEKIPRPVFGHKPQAGPSTAPRPALPQHVEDVFSAGASQLVPHDAEAWRAPSFQKSNQTPAVIDKGKRRADPGPQSISKPPEKRARTEAHAGTETMPGNRKRKRGEVDESAPLATLAIDFDMIERDAGEGKYARSWLTWEGVGDVLLAVGRRRAAKAKAAEEREVGARG